MTGPGQQLAPWLPQMPAGLPANHMPPLGMNHFSPLPHGPFAVCGCAGNQQLHDLVMMQMLMMMKGHGEGSVDTGSWYHVTTPPRRGKGHGEKKPKERTEEEPPEEGQRPGGGGGGGPGEPSDHTPTEPTEESDESSVNTSEVRSMLRRRARGGPP